ncbi:HAD-IIA family hydrolase [Mangrovicoccus ximenensis]|uniref:HAD-IIA family hydrolase n=1 Tax=Mangrovicoccus ximenensis TaxID=1911570 RepID=UPI001F02AB6B|nr:HAD-IIA family hydrolase [Mangrovicoccus ximenensis]
MTLLRLQDETLGHGGRAVLSGVSLTLAPGERVVLLGRSGAGKSTLLAAVHDRLRAETRVALVPQEHGLVPQLSAEKNALMGRLDDHGALRNFRTLVRPCAEDRAGVAQVLSALELEAQARQRVETLSGGQKQRVALPASAGGAARGTGNLSEAAREADLVLLDAYGVLNVGETPIPGAAERVAALRAAGKRVAVVSNSAGYPKRHMMARWQRLGFDFSESEVTSSREALLERLRGDPRHWGIMLGTGHGTEDLGDLKVSFLGDDPRTYAEAEGFLLIGASDWTEARQKLLEAALAAQPRPVFCGNPDLVAPRENGLSLEPGYWAHRLADATGIAPVFCGKPFPEIFDLARARNGPALPPGRVLMVGDTLHTDILGAQARGFRTALVTGHGAMKALGCAQSFAQAGLRPDFVMPSI